MAARRLRIQLVSTSLMLGGAELQVFHLASELKRRGHEVSVVSMRQPEALTEELERLEVPHDSLAMRRGVADPRGLFRLARLIRAWRPDVVHSHMVHANLLSRVCRLLAPIPVLISTAHSISEGARWREIAYRLTDRLCDLTTNVCQDCVKHFVAVGAAPKDRIRYVPNGLDLTGFEVRPAVRTLKREELGVSPDTFLWLAVGYLDTPKDYPTLIAAARRVSLALGTKYVSAERPFKVVVAGTGPLRERLASMVEGAGLRPAEFVFLGQRTDVPELMAAADGFVMSSAWEGLPMVLLEAGASRLPAVVTDVGGCREVVVDGVTGLISPPHDPDALANAMLTLGGSSPEALISMGRRAREHVEANFGLHSVVDRWEAIYEELLARRLGA